ncbi:unnamed protein product [Cuscuta europaea]|uniref:Uncharacterized protein n=1 Tax=Cuscuta europaea TaxID=41803 RepID=A0A9P0ZD70_CUSEU|nr:unnamed protein product [Cuscuta europaea]
MYFFDSYLVKEPNLIIRLEFVENTLTKAKNYSLLTENTLCREHSDQGKKLVAADRERYQKMVLLEASNKDTLSAIQKQQGMIEGLTSVTQTLPEALEQIASTQASEFQKLSLMIGDLDEAKKGEEDPQHLKPRPTRASPIDPTPYYEATFQKKRPVGIPRHPSPPKKASKKKKALSFREWRLGGSQRIDKSQFDDSYSAAEPIS